MILGLADLKMWPELVELSGDHGAATHARLPRELQLRALEARGPRHGHGQGPVRISQGRWHRIVSAGREALRRGWRCPPVTSALRCWVGRMATRRALEGERVLKGFKF